MNEADKQTELLAADTEPPSTRLHPPPPSEDEETEPVGELVDRLQLCIAKAAPGTQVKSTGSQRALVTLSPAASGRKGSSERAGF